MITKDLSFTSFKFYLLLKVKNNITIKQTFEIKDEQQGFMVIEFHLIDFMRHMKYNQKNHQQ